MQKSPADKTGLFCVDGGTAGIEHATFNALSVLEMSHKVYGAISANIPIIPPAWSDGFGR